MWDSVSHQELTRIIEDSNRYHQKYCLVFSHYDLDKILSRIGVNEQQKQARGRKTTVSYRHPTVSLEPRNSFSVSNGNITPEIKPTKDWGSEAENNYAFH